ncbi:MAG TPA: NUDIX hydrolase [Dehalococcoidia bacterium]|nr:NUDIX hydrolase [Dehalococcoidia bacterium]
MPQLTHKLLGAAAVLQDEAGRVLLVKHSYGMLNWELPGGGAELHESLVETALREVREETGLDVTAERLTGIYYDPTHPLGEFVHFVFVCRRTTPQDPVPAPPEITACGFWSPEELPRPISDLTIRRIRDALAPARSLLPVTVGTRLWLE